MQKDIINKHSSDSGATHIEEMKIETNPELSYPLPLKHYKFLEEIEKLLEVVLIELLMSPCATPIIVVPWKSKPKRPFGWNEMIS